VSHHRLRCAARTVLLGLVPCLLAPVALAGEGPRPRIAVLDVKPVGPFDPNLVAGLSPLVATEAARFPVQVLSGGDVANLLGAERRRQLLGCTETSCLAEIGGALGAGHLLVTDVSQVGEVWLLSMTLYDLTRTKVVKRLTERVEKVSGLVDRVSPAVRQLLSAFAPPGGLVVSVSAPPPPPPSRAPRYAGMVLDGAGVAVLALGVGFGVAAKGSYDTADRLRTTALPSDYSAFEGAKSAARQQALVADVLYGVGAAALATGLVLTFTGLASERAAVVPMAARGGAGVLVAGGF
jgi:hypothetical protein